jgi:hypothetical protein
MKGRASISWLNFVSTRAMLMLFSILVCSYLRSAISNLLRKSLIEYLSYETILRPLCSVWERLLLTTLIMNRRSDCLIRQYEVIIHSRGRDIGWLSVP